MHPTDLVRGTDDGASVIDADRMWKGVEGSSDVPEGWVLTTIGAASEVNPPKPPRDFLPADAPVNFVPMLAVDADSGTIAAPLTRAFAEVRGGFTAFREDDVIVAKITPCMENGKAAIARNLTNGIGFGSTEFHVLRPTGAAIPEHLFYYVRRDVFRQAAEANMTGSVGQRRVPAVFVVQAPIPLPPLAEQIRIVAQIEALLGRAEVARARLSIAPMLLQRFRQSVLAAACSGRLTEEWRGESQSRTLLDHPEQLGKDGAQSRPVFPVGTGPEPIPESWRWLSFGSLVEELRNGVATPPGYEPPGTPILRISAVRSGRVDLGDIRYLPGGDNLVTSYGLRNSDLLFTRYNGSLDLTGVCGMVRGLGSDILLHPDKLIRVRVDQHRVLPEYAEIYFASPPARDRIMSSAKSTAGQHGVSGKDIREQPIVLPPMSEQHEIVRRVEALFNLADAIEARVAAATARVDRLTQAILAKAFRGELVPTEAELARREGRDYEPASVLLERIRAEREGRHAASKGRSNRRQLQDALF